jgi:hypothetical protein
VFWGEWELHGNENEKIQTYIPTKAIGTFATDIVASTAHNKLHSIVTARSRTPFCLFNK